MAIFLTIGWFVRLKYSIYVFSVPQLLFPCTILYALIAMNNPIHELIRLNPKTEAELSSAKRKIARAFRMSIVTNRALLAEYRDLLKANSISAVPSLETLLMTRKTRTLSGVAPLTVSTKAFPCPGRCTYCPTEVRMPKSYLSTQPAAARALSLNFDPYLQIQRRLDAFYDNGHRPEKIDVRILGGTWSFYLKNYQTWFVKKLYQAMNEYVAHSGREQNKIKARFTLSALQDANESATHKCIGLSIETRPDYVNMQEIIRLRTFGVTKVEIGVQSLNDDVQRRTKRDHGKQESAYATRLLKNAGFKVAYHIMPNLPGETPEGDIKSFEELFTDPDFKPDYLKIYPCVVLKNSMLYREWQAGKYEPYSSQEFDDVLVRIKSLVPRWTRIERIFRDIPSHQILAGNTVTNYREFLQKKMAERGLFCRCIRCREVRSGVLGRDAKIFDETYTASEGEEHFISYESLNKKILYAFVRLRLPHARKGEYIPILHRTALIRELHTYGQLAPIGEHSAPATQHKGLGKKLMAIAENTARSAGYKKIAVISGTGVRSYYRKLGYRLEKEFGYMIKTL